MECVESFPPVAVYSINTCGLPVTKSVQRAPNVRDSNLEFCHLGQLFHVLILLPYPKVYFPHEIKLWVFPEGTRRNEGEVIIHVLPQIETKGLSMVDIDALMEKVHRAMSEKFLEINKEVSAHQSSGSS
ncbi:unnamed protein product [Callosobruchus maculatus]|uniref:Uncharacterized protein n=1 Tax=Callosobruchus maculatus TaxID=64391 RepID=A0A653CMU2_CALMS|nr:unnamed protein product [Callosobruchus maculatus]